MAVARAVASAPGLQLAGIEGYEGLLVSGDRAADVQAVDAFVAQIAQLARDADADGLFGAGEILVSAGGSAYFDLVARGFESMGGLSRPVRAVLRSGCYLTSDHGSYHRLIGALDELSASTDAPCSRSQLATDTSSGAAAGASQSPGLRSGLKRAR